MIWNSPINISLCGFWSHYAWGYHSGEVIWASWSLPPSSDQLFLQQLVKINNKANKSSAFCLDNPPVTSGSPHKGLVKPKVLTNPKKWQDLQSIRSAIGCHRKIAHALNLSFHNLDSSLWSICKWSVTSTTANFPLWHPLERNVMKLSIWMYSRLYSVLFLLCLYHSP